MAGKRSLGAHESADALDAVQYPSLPKRPRAHETGDLTFEDYVPLNFQNDDLFVYNSDSESDSLADSMPNQSAGPKWTLARSAVPSNAKKIYCVRRGAHPGFYFEWSGSDGAQAQVDGFTDNLFQSFPQGKKAAIKPATLDQIIAEAVDFMNHSPQQCRYNCRGKCAVEESLKSVNELDKPQHRRKRRRPGMCRTCQQEPPCMIPGEDWRICYACWSSDSMQEAIRKSAREFQLNQEQTDLLELVAQGRNVFYTGAAGTGKSRVLEAIVALTKKLELMRQVLAPTGMAAINVFGTTLHMFAGWTVKLAKSSEEDLRHLAHEKRVWKRLRSIDVLIIDEISMVESDTLTRLHFMMQEANNNSSKPFGGVQVVISGDFYQLPPVLPFETCIVCGDQLEGWQQRQSTYHCRKHGTYRDEDKWCFKSAIWKACKFANVQLMKVHRQTDPRLMQILDAMRKDVDWTQEQEDLLLHHEHDVVFDEAVKLMPRRQEVDDINDAHMRKLPGQPRRYRCIDNLHWAQQHPEFQDHSQPDGMSKLPFASLQHHTHATDLEIKEDMQVILLHNLDIEAGLANGTSGKVIGFESVPEWKLPRTKAGPKDVSKFGEKLISHEHRNYVERRIREFYEAAESKQWPIVRFNVGGGTVERTIYPHCALAELGDKRPYSLLSRTQIPLIAGWALTIHKSQGMTLSNVVVSLDKCFAPGQAYVALSRVKSLRNMIVQTIPNEARLLRPEETVQQFMQETFEDQVNKS